MPKSLALSTTSCSLASHISSTKNRFNLGPIGAEPLRHTEGGTWRSAIWMTLCMVSEVFWLSLLRLVLGVGWVGVWRKQKCSKIKSAMKTPECHQSEMRSYRIRAWFAQFPAGRGNINFVQFETLQATFFVVEIERKVKLLNQTFLHGWGSLRYLAGVPVQAGAAW